VITLGIVLTILSLLILWGISSKHNYDSFLYKVKSGLFFWLGDIRRVGSFPWVTWALNHHEMELRDVREASAVCRPGDIGLHKDNGFLSNLAIPGAFKHAWICVDDHMCVEAVSEGVLKRDDMTPLVSDFAVILRPKGVTEKEIQEAVVRANSIVGHPYDANFDFDFKETDEALFGTRAINDAMNNRSLIRNLTSGKFHAAFSCTEVASFCWYRAKEKLGIYKTQHSGREAIIADDFLRMNFDVVYASPSITEEWAIKYGLHEEGRCKISDYRKKTSPRA
jgi:hypothetical protein